MNSLMNKIIGLSKWPIAIYMLLSLPAYVQSLSYFNIMNTKFACLMAGFFFYFITKGMADKDVRNSLQILAHESTHAFFALISFHKVTRISLAEDNSGGSITFEGDGNWLITISPYFFPLFAFFFIIAVSIYNTLIPEALANNIFQRLLICGILGFFVGYHMDTVGSQIHEKQTDLPKVSYAFCALFLPSANLWAIGSILAFNSRGWSGLSIYANLIEQLNIRNLNYILSFFS